MESWFDSNFQ